MKQFIFTNGKKPIKTYVEISNKNQGVYKKGENMRTFMTDDISVCENTTLSTRFEEVE